MDTKYLSASMSRQIIIIVGRSCSGGEQIYMDDKWGVIIIINSKFIDNFLMDFVYMDNK